MLVKGAPDGWWDLKKPCKKPCRTSRVHGTWIIKTPASLAICRSCFPDARSLGFILWLDSTLRCCLTSMWNPTVEIRWSIDCIFQHVLHPKLSQVWPSYVELSHLHNVFLNFFLYWRDDNFILKDTHTCLKFSPVHDFVSPWNMTDLFLHDI